MSTIQSSSDHVIINADGSSKDIKFQANGVEKASISSAGAFTSTTIDATKLTGTIPNFTSTGIDDNADATAITIDSSERIGIGRTSAGSFVDVYNTGNYTGLRVETTVGAEVTCQLKGGGTSSSANVLDIRNGSNGSLFEVRQDGRGLSQFTAKAWVVWTGGGTSINDSHNVSSITYLGTGIYEINYSNSLAGTDRYAINVTPSDKSGYWNNGIASIVDGESNASKTRILTMRSTTGGTENVDNIYAIVFGDN